MLELKDNEVGVPYVEGSNEYIEVYTRREDKDANDLVAGEYKLGTPYVNPRLQQLVEEDNKVVVTDKVQEQPKVSIATAPEDFNVIAEEVKPKVEIKEEKRQKAVNRLFGKMFSL